MVEKVVNLLNTLGLYGDAVPLKAFVLPLMAAKMIWVFLKARGHLLQLIITV